MIIAEYRLEELLILYNGVRIVRGFNSNKVIIAQQHGGTLRRILGQSSYL